MNGRAIAVLLAVFAVATAGGGAVAWWKWSSRPRFSEAPVLTPLQTKGLITFGKTCTSGRDCEEPLSCAYDLWRNRFLCLASECRTDTDCPAGLACRVSGTKGPATGIRLCSIEGDRREGERCEMFSRKRATSCARGLLCEEFCGRPCKLGDDSTCPDHSICAEGWNGPTCVPSCKGLTCPVGTECVELTREMSVCTRPSGTNCQRIPCPKGQRCQVERTRLPDAIGMWCGTPCENTASCSPGSLCLHGFCRRECSPKVAGSCPEGQTCTWYPDDQVGACEVAVP